MATKKLTTKQQKLLDAVLEFGGWVSRKYIATYHSVSVADALVKKGMLEVTETRNYSLTLWGRGHAMADAAHLEPAAIAANVNADAAPATEYVYRTTARPAWRGETVPNDGFTRSYSANHAVWSAADCVVYNRPLSLNEQARYELLPVSENAYVFAIGERVVYLENDDEYTISAHEDGRYHLAHDVGDGVQFARAEQLVPAPDAAQTAAAEAVEMERFFTMTDAQKFSELINQADVIRKDAEQIAELERELEAVKQMFDGYQTAARETEQQLTRDLEAARTEAAALREAFERSEKYLAIEQQVKDERLSTLMDEADKLVAALDNISPMEGLTRLLSFRRVYNGFVQELHRAEAQTDAALVTARQRADDGTRLTTAQVIAQSEFAPED